MAEPSIMTEPNAASLPAVWLACVECSQRYSAGEQRYRC
jgi:hypothetical protein